MRKPPTRWVAGGLITVCLALSACGGPVEEVVDEGHAATMERVKGTLLHRIHFTDTAIENLALQTAPVRGAAHGKVIPSDAVLYDASGQTWAYIGAGTNTFVRERISVDSIDDGQAVLSKGPPAGTRVVTVGVMELFGTENEIGH